MKKPTRSYREYVKLLLFILLAAGFCMGLLYLRYQANLKELRQAAFTPSAATRIAVSGFNISTTSKHCYPGVCYVIRGKVTNNDAARHTVKLVTEFFEGGKYLITGPKKDLAVEPNATQEIELDYATGFASQTGTIRARVYSIDGEDFQSPNRCTKSVSFWWGISELCGGGGWQQ